VPGVDGEQLALDIGREIRNPGDPWDLGWLVAERPRLDGPLVVVLHRDVQAWILRRDDPVDRRVGEDRPLVEIVALVARTDLGLQDVGGSDRVLAGHHRDARGALGTGCDAGRDGRRHILQDRHSHRGGDHVCGRERCGEGLGILGRVDGAEVAHVVSAQLVANLVHLIGVGGLELLDQLVGHVSEGELIAPLGEQQTDEAAPDVPGAEVNCTHDQASPRIAMTSSAEVASRSFST